MSPLQIWYPAWTVNWNKLSFKKKKQHMKFCCGFLICWLLYSCSSWYSNALHHSKRTNTPAFVINMSSLFKVLWKKVEATQTMQTTGSTESRCFFQKEGTSHDTVLSVSIQTLRSAIFQNCWIMDALIEHSPIFTHGMLATYPVSFLKINIIFLCFCPWSFTKVRLNSLQWMSFLVLHPVMCCFHIH